VTKLNFHQVADAVAYCRAVAAVTVIINGGRHGIERDQEKVAVASRRNSKRTRYRAVLRISIRQNPSKQRRLQLPSRVVWKNRQFVW
jgi:predicted chitinase